ncbi:hypothetical protein RhiirA1_542691 [Rhizophagus irregularis]|uniref:Uncharacterized protein n=1 Tax=Rhizophagus irregularis TaxID=588596 RepID=A0A2N0QV94_9GLOM|nr:hypothetical protein RhiirA1_542691 [Rhizophagus irregularis]
MELRCMFGVFYSGFSHCTSSFPEVYVFIFCFLFFLVVFFDVILFSLGVEDTGKFDRHGGLVLQFQNR